MDREGRIKLSKSCIVANCNRVVYLLENEFTGRVDDWGVNAELKQKMAEIRRDMIRLSKDL